MRLPLTTAKAVFYFHQGHEHSAANSQTEVPVIFAADVATPNGRETAHFDYREEQATENASLVQNESRYTAWMTAMPERGPAYVQLTANELAYVDPTDTDYHQYPERREFVAGLLDGEHGYEVVAEFGHWERTETLRDDFRQAVFGPEVEGQERQVVILASEDRVGSDETTRRAGVRDD